MPPGAQFCVSPQKAVCESVLCPQGLHLVQLVVFAICLWVGYLISEPQLSHL